jgi:Tfp pilus assembly protein PilX
MATDPTAQWPPASDEPTVAFHGQAAVPPNRPTSYPRADYPATAVPYQRPPRGAAVPILSTLVVILLLIVLALTGHSVSAASESHKREEQLATQLANEQRRVKELQAQVAAAKAEVQKVKQGQDGAGSPGTVEQLTSCADALDGVLKARSGSDFTKAFEAMKNLCKIAGIPLF